MKHTKSPSQKKKEDRTHYNPIRKKPYLKDSIFLKKKLAPEKDIHIFFTKKNKLLSK
jgi:hypothetical protein